MKIGVVFCGGCQSRFDRHKAFETIVKKTGVTIDYAKEGKPYDYLLTISGCPNSCQNTKKYIYNKRLSLKSIDEIIEIITEINKI